MTEAPEIGATVGASVLLVHLAFGSPSMLRHLGRSHEETASQIQKKIPSAIPLGMVWMFVEGVVCPLDHGLLLQLFL